MNKSVEYIEINLKLFALARENNGFSEKKIVLPLNSHVYDLSSSVKFEDNYLFAVNKKYVEQNYLLKDKDEVAIFSPVSGG